MPQLSKNNHFFSIKLHSVIFDYFYSLFCCGDAVSVYTLYDVDVDSW